jgi:hypothetical protein
MPHSRPSIPRSFGPELCFDHVVAKRTVQLLVDDLDGGDADQTVRFALDGVAYTIDLNKRNATRLRGVFEPYVAAGRRVPSATRATGRARATARRPARVDVDQHRAIRAWAQSKGIAVSARGRIARAVVDRYDAEAGR